MVRDAKKKRWNEYPQSSLMDDTFHRRKLSQLDLFTRMGRESTLTPLISLVSGTFNRYELLVQMCQSFRENLLPGIEYEIVIIDGGSTDGTLEWAKSQNDITLIEDGDLLGAISAFTRGAFIAQGKYVLLANDDITFRENSIIPAIIYLETNLKCGAVAFADNRVIPGHFTKDDYKTLRMGATLNGVRTSVVYAQVGLFRKWLGDKLNWWTGEHEEMLGAQVYAGDNSLSGQIWNKGYTVDPVPECIIEDHVAMDELRQINYEKGIQANDSHFFYDQWPNGEVVVMSDPQLPQQDRRSARILLLTLYEPGWEVTQKHPVVGKRGLRDALARGKNKYGATHIVQEFDYLSVPQALLHTRLREIVDSFKPDLILTQIQSWLPLTANILEDLKNRSGASVVNWNGDQALGGLIGASMLPILRQIDLQLITNIDAVKYYEENHIRWAYWQVGIEQPEGDVEHVVSAFFQQLGRENPFHNPVEYPVVYLASLRSPERLAIAEIVNEFGGKVFQTGDDSISLYNFAVGKLIYNRAKIAISDNGFTSRGFVSNRLFQALGAGGAVVLQQHVDGLDELTGLKHLVHYVEWRDLIGLREWIKKILADWPNPQVVAQRGNTFALENYSFDAQIKKLMELIRVHLGSNEQLLSSVAMQYVGKNKDAFGLGVFPSGIRYEYQPGRLLYVRPEDYEYLNSQYPNEWERMEV